LDRHSVHNAAEDVRHNQLLDVVALLFFGACNTDTARILPERHLRDRLAVIVVGGRPAPCGW
jgi:hypothetical protein